MRIHTKTIVLLAASLLVAIASGCFQANNKFYRDSDIINDKRFEGRFDDPDGQTNSPGYHPYVIKLGEHGHYIATCSEEDKWIKLDVVLFKCSTNMFLDISRIAVNGLKDEPGIGPTWLGLLQLATQYKTHSVIGIRFTDNGFQLGCNNGNPVYFALRKYPYLKFRTGTETEPIDPHHKILTNPTEELYKFLQTEATNDEVFKFNGGFVRSSD
jgi:hypothetical protein